MNANNHYFPASAFHASCTSGWANWPVANDESTEGGYMSVLNATAMSVNSAFAQMGTEVDLCSISKIAKSLLVHSASPHSNPWMIQPSMILGTNYISPLTMATAYAAFANKGVVCTPVAITKVTTPEGSNLDVPKTTCTQGIPAKIANAVAYALQRVMQYGTAVSANPGDGVPILSKTGTTDYAHENWLVTSTTKVSTATWIGNVQGVGPNGTQADMHYVYFQYKNSGPLIQGNNVKFFVAKPVLRAINSKFGGAPFATPEHSLLYPYVPPPPPAPK